MVILICISLVISDTEHLFTCLLVIWMKVMCHIGHILWRNIYSFLNWVVFVLLNFRSCLYLLDVIPYHIHDSQVLPPILWAAFPLRR